MEITLAGQTTVFLYSALVGVILGIIYDTFTVMRGYLKAGKVLSVVMDIIYWITACIILVLFVLIQSGGEMRWYILLGAFCGGFIYKNTISFLYFRVLDIIIKVVVYISRMAVKPIYFISRSAYRTAKKVVRRKPRKEKQQ